MTAPTYTSTSTIGEELGLEQQPDGTALVKKHSTRNSAEYTGLRERITPSAGQHQHGGEGVEQDLRPASFSSLALTGTRVGGLVGGDHRLVALADGEQLVLGHDVLAAILHVVLVDARLDDGIHRAGLLAEAAVDALEQVDVVARGAARAVGGRRPTRW